MEIAQLNTVLVKNNIFGDRVENLYCTYYIFLCESNVNVYESVFVRYVRTTRDVHIHNKIQYSLWFSIVFVYICNIIYLLIL